jgi:hypothetical protein
VTDRRGFLGALAAAVGLGFVARKVEPKTLMHFDGPCLGERCVCNERLFPVASYSSFYRERIWFADNGGTVFMSRIEA